MLILILTCDKERRVHNHRVLRFFDSYFEEVFLGKRALQEYDVINLWEVEATLAFEQPLLLPFVPIMKGGEQKQLIERALNELRADEQLKEIRSFPQVSNSMALRPVRHNATR